jgi:hypothetical protein
MLWRDLVVIDGGHVLRAGLNHDKLLSKLHRHSVVDSDAISSMRLFDGEMKALVYRIDRFESKTAELFKSRSTISSCISGIQCICRDLINVQQTTNQVNSDGPTAINTRINSALTSLTTLSAPFPSVQSAIQSACGHKAFGQSGQSLISNLVSNSVIPHMQLRLLSSSWAAKAAITSVTPESTRRGRGSRDRLLSTHVENYQHIPMAMLLQLPMVSDHFKLYAPEKGDIDSGLLTMVWKQPSKH